MSWSVVRGRVRDGGIQSVSEQLATHIAFVDVVIVKSNKNFVVGETDESAKPVRMTAAVAVQPAAWLHVRAKGLVLWRFPHGALV